MRDYDGMRIGLDGIATKSGLDTHHTHPLQQSHSNITKGISDEAVFNRSRIIIDGTNS